MSDIVESDGTSDLEDQAQAWDSDQRSTQGLVLEYDPNPQPHNECAVGHRVKASRSVLALVLDEECVFAGLQGGDILVS